MRRPMACVLALAALLPLATGCAMNRAQQRAMSDAGGAGGAGATGSTVRGVIIEAAVGGAGGAAIGHQMDAQAEELAYALPAAAVERVGEGIAVIFPEGPLFRRHSDRLTPAARRSLRTLAASLNKYPNTKTLIVDHTGSHGGAQNSMDLSDRRARSAASFISAEGVDRTRICLVGRGEAEPIALRASHAGRRRNQRVEIAIYANDAPRSASRH